MILIVCERVVRDSVLCGLEIGGRLRMCPRTVSVKFAN
jgi:hypothetical protein